MIHIEDAVYIKMCTSIDNDNALHLDIMQVLCQLLKLQVALVHGRTVNSESTIIHIEQHECGRGRCSYINILKLGTLNK